MVNLQNDAEKEQIHASLSVCILWYPKCLIMHDDVYSPV